MAPNGAAPPRLCVAVAADGPGPTCDRLLRATEVFADAARRADLGEPVWRTVGAHQVGLLPVTDPVPAAVDRFTQALDLALGLHNADRDRLRLRVALHRGLVDDPDTCLGPGVAQAIRLLGSRALRDALDEAPDTTLALLLSDRVPTCPWWVDGLREILLWHSNSQDDCGSGEHPFTGDAHTDFCDRAWLWTPGWQPVATALAAADQTVH
ncbi:hypothetical protein V5P93_007107 [Actinokineospora auranticolor]|uniref:Uncharacterized protein n=1 Tax=Actinokineospora auranticolor TaxID=155976 RepID=A0A2S6GGU0_9PSEU|nr:hypothetical protein [Actinokineospora auranticolor]PPK64444.1 hypothetical protein CLV40_1197 [Actinokineospora auranticolor]